MKKFGLLIENAGIALSILSGVYKVLVQSKDFANKIKEERDSSLKTHI